MKIDVILPAGGRIDFGNIKVKALLSLDGQTLLERTIQVLRATGQVQRIVVIGPQELQQHPATRAADAVLLEGESGMENVFRGLQWLHDAGHEQHATRVLIVATDLPFLTAESITQFLDACPLQAAVSLPVIRREAVEARFPDCAGRYVRLRDGQWTLGGAFLLDPQTLLQNRAHLERVFAARKSGVKLALLLGPLLIARWLCGQVKVAHVQQRCERILQCQGATIFDCAPELAFDIDSPRDYEYTLQQMAQSQQ